MRGGKLHEQERESTVYMEGLISMWFGFPPSLHDPGYQCIHCCRGMTRQKPLHYQHYSHLHLHVFHSISSITLPYFERSTRESA